MNARNTILQAAFAIAKASPLGLDGITREGVCDRVGVATGTVNYHFQTMRYLRDEVLKLAIKQEHLMLIGRALMQGHKLAKHLPLELRQRAVAAITAAASA